MNDLDPPPITRFTETLLAAGHPVVGASRDAEGNFFPHFAPGATPQQIAATLAAVAAFDPSQAAHTAWLLARRKTRGKDYYDTGNFLGRLIRAEALVLIDELNILRTWIRDFKTEVAAATSLADLKTRVAALPNLPDRTPAQARTAIRNKIDAE